MTLILFIGAVTLSCCAWGAWFYRPILTKQSDEASGYCLQCRMPYPLSDLRYTQKGYLCRWHYEKGEAA